MEQLLALLPVLICPIAMGLMMWMMMRGNTSHTTNSHGMPEQTAGVNRLTDSAERKSHIELLRAHVDELKAQEALLVAQLNEGSVEHVSEDPPHPAQTTQPERATFSATRAA